MKVSKQTILNRYKDIMQFSKPTVYYLYYLGLKLCIFLISGHIQHKYFGKLEQPPSIPRAGADDLSHGRNY